LALAGLASVLLAAPLANARPEYTGYIFDAIPGMVCTPQCIICHSDNQGGATTWFAKGFGAAAGPKLSSTMPVFRGAALKAELDKIDSNLDMFLDVERLKQGRDPNTAQTDTTSICVPSYGCGARIAPAVPIDSHAAGAALLSGLVLIGLLLRRKR
jgi:hypothetical protein